MPNTFNTLVRLLCLLLLSMSSLATAAPPVDTPDVYIDGELMIVHIDYLKGKGTSKFVYHMKEQGTGEIHELEFEHKPPKNLKTGDKLNIRGKQNGKKLWVLDIAGAQEEASSPEQPATTSEPQVEGAATEYRAIYMLVNMVDSLGNPLHTFSETDRINGEGSMFDNPYSLDSVNREGSFGKVAIPKSLGRVEIVTIEKPDGCPYYTIASRADTAANNLFNGTDSVSNYNRKIYWVPPSSVSDCNWLALGQVGSYGSTATRLSWTTDNRANALIHEIGHNNGTVANEYADRSGSMGYCCTERKFNSVHLHQIGWLPAADVVTVTSGGTYYISPLGDAGAANPQLLLIEKDSSIFSYYLSYRQVKNLDLNLSSTYTRGVNIHNGRLGDNWSYFVQSLSDGSVFEDALNGIYITQVTHDNTRVELSISLTGPQPPADPTALVATATSETTIDLAWTDNAIIETGYSVERSDDGSIDWNEVASLAANVESYTDTGLAPSTAYYYRVIANNGSTPSDNYSNIDSATTDAPPPFVNQYVSSETAVSGTVSGSYSNTQNDGGSVQSIRERESGGRPANRYSYLEHRWFINVIPGNAVTLFIDARRSNSSDGDAFTFEYSINGGNYNPATIVSNTSDEGSVSVPLPNNTNGTVTVRVQDTDNTSGNRALDTVYIDQIYIRTDNDTNGTPPNAPTMQSPTNVSASQVDLSWTNVGNEFGYTVERSTSGGSWVEIGTTGADIFTYQDASVSADTDYEYQVSAYNGSGSSPTSNIVAVTTPSAPPPPPPTPVSLTASGYKSKGVQHATLTWNTNEISGDVEVYRDGNATTPATTSNDGSHDDNIGNKGGGSYTYQICDTANTNCSAEVPVTF